MGMLSKSSMPSRLYLPSLPLNCVLRWRLQPFNHLQASVSQKLNDNLKRVFRVIRFITSNRRYKTYRSLLSHSSLPFPSWASAHRHSILAGGKWSWHHHEELSITAYNHMCYDKPGIFHDLWRLTTISEYWKAVQAYRTNIDWPLSRWMITGQNT